ncbi:MAG: long-chain fatty acid--CoA ligase [bacterium]
MPHAYETRETVAGLFFYQAERFGDRVFFYSKYNKGRPSPDWTGMTWGQAAKEVRDLGAGLIELGLGEGERAAVFSHNRPRWIISDLAVSAAGGISVPVYPTSTDDQLEFILKDSGARAVMVEDQKLMEQALRVKPQTGLEYIISLTPVDDPPDPCVINYEEALEKGAGSDAAQKEFERRMENLSGESVGAIIYTSGTTGEPKGVVLTQSNFMAQIDQLLSGTLTGALLEREIGLVSLCHLPLCHIYGRTAEYFVQIAMGGRMYFAESIQKVPENLLEVRPQMLITIPRLYEKVYETVQVKAGRMKGIGKRLYDWALKVGFEVVDHMSNGRRIPPLTAIKFSLAGTLVYNRIKKAAGLDRLVFAASGGGALAEETNRFFRALNIQVGEGYGLTETTSAITWNHLEFMEPPPDKWIYRKGLEWLIDTMVVMQGRGKNPFSRPLGMIKLTVATNTVVPLLVMKPGTVGRPCKDTEIKIAQDGEILARGPQVFHRDKGYFNRPDYTAEAFTEDGFFLTGDIGEFDEDGFLKITDRKKELLVTAGGKNVAPHPIELLLTLDPYVEQACVVGDKRKYLSALIVPQFELLEKLAREKQIEYQTVQELIERPEIVNLYREKVDQANQKLARYEQIKTFRLLPVPFTEETGELTPTQKMKRRVITDKFKDDIEACYDN